MYRYEKLKLYLSTQLVAPNWNYNGIVFKQVFHHAVVSKDTQYLEIWSPYMDRGLVLSLNNENKFSKVCADHAGSCPLKDTVFILFIKSTCFKHYSEGIWIMKIYILNDRQRAWGMWFMSPRIYTVTGSVWVALHHRRVCRVWGKCLFHMIEAWFYLDMHRFSIAFHYVIYTSFKYSYWIWSSDCFYHLSEGAGL